MTAEWPWTRPLRWTEVSLPGKTIRMNADATIRASVAEGLDVEGIESLSADLRIVPWLDGLAVEGSLRARVTRTCGVSLESFEEAIDEPFVLRFVPDGSPNAAQPAEGDVELDLEADEPPECVAGDAIDLASYVAEQLALALNPFPRKPGVEFQPPENPGSTSPFAALASLKSIPPEAGE